MHSTHHESMAPSEAPIGLTDAGWVRVLRAPAGSQQLTRSELVSHTVLARENVGSVVYKRMSG